MGDDITLSMDKPRDGESVNDVEVRLTSIGRYRHGLREYIAEFWGTFVLILFGDGVVAQTVLSGQAHGNQVTINICWGVAVMMGIYTSGGISGAHLNPAVTFTLAVFRKFPRNKVIGYWIAQGCGAYLACAVLYANYLQAFNAHDGGIRSVLGPNGTAGIFSTYPAPFMTVEGAFFEQVLATGILVFGIFAINDLANTGAGSLGPLMVGLLVVAIGMAFGWQTGYAINPARDLAPRLFAYLIYGSEVFWAGSNYFFNYSWIPVAAPMLGAPIGAFLYDAFMFTGEGPLQRIFQITN